ncbi:MAG: hypothetical protein DRP46_02320 [Candidatus Zixiibacteriota bacterium]|nr:MAG: hypothetical protein DRP46_02320 [candidate division Zixibacteria bacterium]
MGANHPKEEEGIIMEPTTPKKTVAVVTDGESFTVAPGQVTMYAGDTVEFHNLTGQEMTIIFPEINIFGKNMVATAPDETVSLTIPEGFTKYGSYPYAVYFQSRRVFAHASMPIIIIYPRRD